MLVELHVENLAVIESATVLFNDALVAITGESGSGKSVLVEALSLAVGGRSDPSSVRVGAESARVDARFLLPGDDGPVERIVTREVPASGRSRAYIDGRPSTAAAVADLLAGVIEIHGQHEYHRLGERAIRCAHLDRFGAIDTQQLNETRAEIATLSAELAALGGDPVEREREIDLLSYQIHEIDAAELDPSEPAQLDVEEARLRDVDRITSGAGLAIEALTDDDRLSSALRALGASPILDEQQRRLEGLINEIRDLRSDLRSIVESVEHNPERLVAIAERRALLANLLRRYGRDIAEVLEFRSDIADRLERLRSHDDIAQRLQTRIEQVTRRLSLVSADIAQRRAEAAPRLSAAVTAQLRRLEMESVTFTVTTGGEDGGEVEFLLEVSPGRALSLAKVASGGELARCMLALDIVLEPLGGAQSVVLDEIDAGLGGATGGAMAKALVDLSARRQVIVITHLPTVAASASQQIAVERISGEAAPRSAIRMVSGDARRREVARMLAGAHDEASLGLADRLLG